MSKSRVESALSCPGCRSPVEVHLDFCHSCGQGQTMVTASSVKLKPRRLPCFFAAAAILALAFAVIMGLTICDFVHQYGVPGGADVSQRAALYMRRGQEERAINLLEESLDVKGANSRAPEWRLLLDQALYDLGKKLAGGGKFRDAVTAFARISSNFAGREEVKKLIVEYTDRGMPAFFGKSEEVDTALEKESRPLSKLEKAVMTAVPGGKERLDLPAMPAQSSMPILPSSKGAQTFLPSALDQATNP